MAPAHKGRQQRGKNPRLRPEPGATRSLMHGRATASSPLRGNRLIDDIRTTFRALTNGAQHSNIHPRGFETRDGRNGLHAARREITGKIRSDQPKPRIALESVHIDAGQVRQIRGRNGPAAPQRHGLPL